MRFFPARFLSLFLIPLFFLGLSATSVAADNPPTTPSPSPTPPATTAPTPTPATLLAPTALSMSRVGSGTPLARGSWISQNRLVLHFQIQDPGGPVVPEVEVERSGVPFTGQPTAAGPTVTVSGETAVVIHGLANGKRYHWQARISTAPGESSAWMADSGSAPFDFAVDRTAPSRPTIQSPTDPKQSGWYNNRVVLFHWSSVDQFSGVAGYSWVLERTARVIPPGTVTPQTSLHLTNLSDGIWFLALRSLDRAGNWSATATYQFQLDRRAPELTWLSRPKFAFNPYRGPTAVHFRFDKRVRATFTLYRVGDTKPIAVYTFPHLAANQEGTIAWSGKLPNGKTVAKGYYFFSARAIDHAANRSAWNVGGISVAPQAAATVAGGVTLFPDNGKLIIISLSHETLYAYDGTKLMVQTLVTTGNPSLPTPTGQYTILGKFHPYEFISPWPQGSPYYYPPSLSNFAMLFRSGGYFIHDAPWRGAFGPGTNGPGQPGTNYGGTHGCVNVPYSPMVFLYGWASIGTPVDVVP